MIKRIIILLMILVLSIQTLIVDNSKAEQNTTIEITIPNYEVSTVEEYDQVSIPNGRTLCIPGNPIVPYYIINKWYPSDYEIQNVTLLEQSGLKTQENLNIKNCELQWGGDTDDNTSFNTTNDWYPKQNYTWYIDDKANDTTKLSILLFPFFYNSSSKESRFYNHYRIKVEYIVSTVEITSVYLPRYTYDIGDEVAINIGIKNKEEPIDLIATADIEYNSKTIDQLPLHSLQSFQGLGEVSLTWNTKDIKWGRYNAIIYLKDMQGFILDRKTISFTVGIPQINITDFQVNPINFTIGDKIQFSTQIANTGDITISGVFTVEIHSSDDKLIDTFRFPFENLTASETKNFQGTWDTTSTLANKNYTILGYATYAGKATPPIEIQLISHEKERKTPGFEYILFLLAMLIIIRRK